MSEFDWQAVLLELLNTTPVIDGQVVDLLDRAWLHVHGATGGVDDVRRLRDDLQHVVWGEADASVLRRYLRSVRQVPRIHDGRLVWDLDADWSARVVLA